MNIKSTQPVCLVTGAGAGRLGAAIARSAASRGFRVAIHYNSSETQAEQLKSEIDETGAECEIFQADLRNESAVENLLNSTYARFSRIDLVVNCASTWLSKPLAETGSKEIIDEFSTNVLGTFLVSKLAGMQMVTQKEGGHIVTIGDWAVERPYRHHAAYLIAKGSISTLTKVLAVELAAVNSNIRVNCIAPGPVLPPGNASQQEVDEMANSTLLRRIGGSESIVQAVFSLTENSFITGVTLPVDGGRTIYANEG